MRNRTRGAVYGAVRRAARPFEDTDLTAAVGDSMFDITSYNS
jgi:hypothetical protein